MFQTEENISVQEMFYLAPKLPSLLLSQAKTNLNTGWQHRRADPTSRLWNSNKWARNIAGLMTGGGTLEYSERNLT